MHFSKLYKEWFNENGCLWGKNKAKCKLQTYHIYTGLSSKLWLATFRNENTPHPNFLYTGAFYYRSPWKNLRALGPQLTTHWYSHPLSLGHDSRQKQSPTMAASSGWLWSCLPAAPPLLLKQSWSNTTFHAPAPTSTPTPTPIFQKKERENYITVWVQQVFITSCLKCPVLSTVRDRRGVNQSLLSRNLIRRY